MLCPIKTIKSQQLFTDVQELSLDKYKGRKTGTAENTLAAEYIVKRFKEIGLKAYKGDYKKPFTFTDRLDNETQGCNIIGYVAGKKPDAIVISAHYDHLGVINGKIYNGADDNASGVGGLLEIASYFAKNPPEHTLIFAAFDAEESRLKGAKAFVKNPTIDISLIKLNVNMDMISRSRKNELYVAGASHYPFLKSYVFDTDSKVKVLFGHDTPKLGGDDWTNQSDHGAFHDQGIPFLYFGVENHLDYHRPTDDFSRINKEFYQNAVHVILETVKNVDKGLFIQKVFRDKLIMQD